MLIKIPRKGAASDRSIAFHFIKDTTWKKIHMGLFGMGRFSWFNAKVPCLPGSVLSLVPVSDTVANGSCCVIIILFVNLSSTTTIRISGTLTCRKDFCLYLNAVGWQTCHFLFSIFSLYLNLTCLRFCFIIVNGQSLSPPPVREYMYWMCLSPLN